MTPAVGLVFHEWVTFDELRILSRCPGPCISIALALPNPRETHTRVKNAVHRIESGLTDTDRGRNAKALLQPIHDAVAGIESEGIWAKAMLLLRSADIFHGYWLRDWTREIARVDDRFHVEPLLATIAREQRFHLLCLSQKHVRLFRCTMFRSEEMNPRGSIPENMDVWMNTRQPDHLLENRSAAGPSTGGMRVRFGTGSDREKHDEHVQHFYQEVDRGVRELLHGDDAPVVLAGVEYEIAIYRRINTHPRLFSEEVRGSPDGMTAVELHFRARELVEQAQSEALRTALKNVDAGPVSSDPREIAAFAAEGRIDDLLMIETEEDDRSNSAALDTICHHGRAFAIRPAEMPRPARILGALRH